MSTIPLLDILESGVLESLKLWFWGRRAEAEETKNKATRTMEIRRFTVFNPSFEVRDRYRMYQGQAHRARGVFREKLEPIDSEVVLGVDYNGQ